MFDLFKKQHARVELNNDSAIATQHGVVIARNPEGQLVELGFHVDRPEVLIAGDQETITDVFEQFGKQGYIPHRMFINVLGKSAHYEAPKAAKVLEALQFS